MSRRRLDKTYSGVFETSELNMRETLPQEDRLFIATPQNLHILFGCDMSFLYTSHSCTISNG